MFKSIVSKITRDQDASDRAFTLDVLSRVREGALYDHLPHAFATERSPAGEYVPLKDRRPSVRHNICRTVVDDTVGLVFSEGHFPSIACEDDEKAPARIGQLVKASRLNDVMVEAATTGSIGSVAVQMRVLQQPDKTFRLFFEPHETTFLTPVFKPYAPDVLDRIIERYKVKGSDLQAKGYPVKDDDLNADFWFRREWDESAEIWFQPVKVIAVTDEERALAANPPQDDARSVTHNLGFVPWVWIKNLPGKLRIVDKDAAAPRYSDIDGACTFFAAIDAMIEIDYLLSQGGRGLKYSADPLLVIKEPPAPSEELVKSPDSALVLDKEGDAKMLEINGASFAVVLDWVRALREFGLENVHGNRADPQKMHGVQSGRAMEMMNQALIWLADKLRISYGENGYRQLIQMAIRAHAAFPLTIDGAVLEAIDPELQFTLNWPPFFLKTADDLFNEAQAMKTLRDAGLISRNTAIANIASNYDIEDVAAEEQAILADKQGEMEMVQAMQPKDAERPAPPSN